MAKTIAFVNQKGGVGKTTSCVNLGSCLQAVGARVLVCDFDPQGNATSGFGVDKGAVFPTVYDVLISGAPVESAIVHTKYSDVLPANKALAGASVEMIDHRLADLAGHAGGELKVAAGVGLLELAAQTGHGGDDEQRNGLQAEGPHPLPQHLEVPQAAVSQGYNLLGLGEQGGAVPAQGNPPAAFLKQGDPQLLLDHTARRPPSYNHSWHCSTRW